MKGLSPQARSLIALAGDEDGPSAGRRARVKQQLAVRLATGGVGIGATQLGRAAVASQRAPSGVAAALVPVAGKAGLNFAAIALYVAGGAALGTATLVPLSMLEPVASQSAHRGQTSSSGVAPSHVTPLVSSPARFALPEAHAANESDELEDTRSAQALPVVSRENVPSRAAAVSPSPTGSRPSSLGVETQLIEAAQEQLAAGQGQRALELLARHREQFPNGELAEERDFAQIMALCRVDRKAEASASAAAFLRATPSSPLVPRLRKSCAFTGEKLR